MTTTTTKPETAGQILGTLPEEAREPNPHAGFGALETARGRLPLNALDVSAHITGLSAEVLVRQTFVNLFSEPLEATYIFPLPDRAAVTSFRLTVAGRTIVGDLKERGQARAEYDLAIQAGHRAAIAEEDRSGTFNLRVGNLPPLEQATVELTLAGPLVYVDGEATFRFPLVVAPRYVPGNFLDVPPVGAGTSFDTDLVPDASRVTPPVLLPGFPNPVRLGLSVEFDPAGLAAPEGGWSGALKSSLHSVVEDLRGDVVRLRVQPGERLNRDFILRFPVAQRSVQTALVASLASSERPGTFALTLVPPADLHAPPRPRDVAFVLDRSGSMGGWKMVAARRALGRMIDTLTDRDRFTVLAFDDSLEFPADAGRCLRPGSDRDRWKTLEWLGQIEARGGTEMGPALETAVELLAKAPSVDRGPGAESILVLITDGQVAGEDVLLKTLQRAAGQRVPRIFALGIDRAVNAGFLKRLADLGGGGHDLVESEERLDEVMDRIHRAIATPTLVDVWLEPVGCEWIGDSLAPSRLPDLFVGAPVTIYGRFLGDARKLKLRVHARDAAGAAWQQELAAISLNMRPVRDVARESVRQPDVLLNLWGRAKVRELEDRYAVGNEALPALAARIVQLSLETHVLSRFTAYIAVDLAEVVNRGGKQHEVVQPVEQPEGWACLTSAAPAPLAKRKMARRMLPAGGVNLRAAAAAPPSPPAADEDLGSFFAERSEGGASADRQNAAPAQPMMPLSRPSRGMATFGKAQDEGIIEKAKSALNAIVETAKSLLHPQEAQDARKRDGSRDQQAKPSEAQREASQDKTAGFTPAEISPADADAMAKALRQLLDEGEPHSRRARLTELLQVMTKAQAFLEAQRIASQKIGQANAQGPFGDPVLEEKFNELVQLGDSLGKRFDAGETDVLIGDEFRAWTERVITLLAALQPSVPLPAPERAQFWA